VTKPEFLQLIDKYLAGQASIEEEQLLLNFFDSFQSDIEWDETLFGVKQKLEDKMLGRLQAAIKDDATNRQQVGGTLPLKRIAAVITGFVLMASVILYAIKKPVQQPVLAANQQAVKFDAEPGSNKAILTLADGSKLVLDAAKNGVLAKAGHISIKKTQNGQLVYLTERTKSTDADAPLAYNTISTPVGGQYQVILPDGTKVWLNASSSLKYPTIFKGRQRVVELTGEGYFEVAKNARMPFSVKANNTEVKVLGTHFNVMAYNNEPAMKTTLLEGSIQLSSGAVNNVLTPGQQGVVNKTGAIKVVEVDAEQSVAWKNGYFDFKRSDIHEIMNQLERWYDIDVSYTGDMPDDEFVGKIKRSAKLSQVLRILQLSHVHFKMEEKKIIVTP
jgi:transmembrane sensor